MSSIQQNIEQITSQIEAAQQKCGRPLGSVQLLAVSKTKPFDAILEAARAGQVAFGENYVQEGVDKVAYFAENHPELTLECTLLDQFSPTKHAMLRRALPGYIPLTALRLPSD